MWFIPILFWFAYCEAAGKLKAQLFLWPFAKRRM